MSETLDAILARLRSEPHTRFVAFGSSNTERRIPGLHWFDWLELGIKYTYGRVFHCINAGLGGDTVRGLLGRFERDVALYQPHVVFVTIGGNDSNPDNGIEEAEYDASLRALADRIDDMGAQAIFQTYYAADVVALGPQHGPAFLRFMEVVRQVAEETGAALIDHHRRWERLRLHQFERYQTLMIDALHVNALGNMLLGLDLMRAFEAMPEEIALDCAEGLEYQRLLDQLEADE
jgi:lysophospholipase L1-like esterase